ncbi:MAG: DegT/DnrJ/EryC1/StrS family aminotransferase [Thermoplasmata archaeon]|nr:DegT/DnrJ/EryC1/StrS family aminotransferase [Thermoplasmata archaeon]
MSSKLAILGGKPAFETPYPIVNPSADRYIEGYLDDVRKILESGRLSGVNVRVKDFEDAIADYLHVARAVAVASNTAGMTLCLSALGVKEKTVLLPSFTFSATALGPYWNGNSMRWIDIDDTLTLSEQQIRGMNLDGLDLLIGVHIFGNPCACDTIADVAGSGGLPVVFDAAHGLGSVCEGVKVGSFGDAEVFSLSSTKLVTSFEGGIVATNDDELAEKITVLRNYGNLPDYSCETPGMNARMPEVSAALGHRMLQDVDEFVRNRGDYGDIYQRKLQGVPGISFQRIRDGCTSSRKDFAILISEEEFGMTRDVLSLALEMENIMTKKYFYPPVHELEAFRALGEGDVPLTEQVSRRILCLPIHNFMLKEDIESVCDCVGACSEESERIVRRVQEEAR